MMDNSVKASNDHVPSAILPSDSSENAPSEGKPEIGSASQSKILLSLLAIIFLTIALRLPLLDIPLERDEGEYAYIAWRYSFNELPYLDWFDQKPPGVFLIYRLALSLPFDGVKSIHIMGGLFALASAICIYFIARRFMAHRWSTVAALLFVVLSADPHIQGTAANTEIFMQLPLIVANLLLLIAIRSAQSRHWLYLAIGVANGIAIACKQVAAVNVIFTMGIFFLANESCSRQRKLSFAAWLAIGIGAVWGGILLFFASQHAAGDFIDNVFTHNFDYIQSVSISNRFDYLKNTLAALMKTEGIVWLFGCYGLLKAKQTRLTWYYLAGWLLAGMAGISASGYYFPHYFQQFLPPLVLLAALGTAEAYKSRPLSSLPSFSRALICGLILTVLPAVTFYPFLFKYNIAEASRAIYPGNPFNEMAEIGKLLAKSTKADDRIYIFGAEPEIFFYAERASATRYIFLFPLYGLYPEALQNQIDTAEKIFAANPAAVVYLPNNLFFAQGTAQYLTDWTKKFLAENYHEIAYLVRVSSGRPKLIVNDGLQEQMITAYTGVYGAVYLRNDLSRTDDNQK